MLLFNFKFHFNLLHDVTDGIDNCIAILYFSLSTFYGFSTSSKCLEKNTLQVLKIRNII